MLLKILGLKISAAIKASETKISGWNSSDCAIFPCRSAAAALDEPQAGHGSPNVALKTQAVPAIADIKTQQHTPDIIAGICCLKFLLII